MNGKEKIRRNFKEDRSLVSVNFEIRKKEKKIGRKRKKLFSVKLKAQKIAGPQLILLAGHPHIWHKSKKFTRSPASHQIKLPPFLCVPF